MNIMTMKHASTRQLPMSERPSGIDLFAELLLQFCIFGTYDAFIFMFNRWYGWATMTAIVAYFQLTYGQAFIASKLFSVIVLVLITLFFKKYENHKYMPRLGFKTLGNAFFSADELTLVKRTHRKFRNGSELSKYEIGLAEQVLKTLIGLNIFNVVNPHTGRVNFRGYEVEEIEVPSVLVELERDSLGLSKIKLTIVAPTDLVAKLDNVNANLVDVVARYFNRSISIGKSDHVSGDYVLELVDGERKTGFDFNDKKSKVSYADDTSLAENNSDVNSTPQYTMFSNLAKDSKDWEVPIMSDVVWNMSKAQHLLIAGKSGSGKTYFVNYVIMMMALHNVSLYLCDPKHSDLSSFDQFVGADRVATTPDEIVEVTQHVVDVMNERYDVMSKKREETKQFQVDFSAFGLKPIVLVIDEMASLMSEFKTKKEANAFQALITQLTMKGRQAGVELVSIMQQANASNIDTQARDQFGFRVLLGNSGSQERQMMFGSQEDYPDVPVGPGHGLYVMDGKTVTPEVLNTPRLLEADNALYKTLEAIFDRYTPEE